MINIMVFKQNNNKKNKTRSICGHQKNIFFQLAQLIQRQWLVASVIVIAGIMLLVNSSAWAAPILVPSNQTVPIPTATPTPTSVPTVTPAPTSTPEPESSDEPVEEDGSELEEDGSELEEDSADFFGNSNEDAPDTEDQPSDENSNINTESSSSNDEAEETDGSLAGEPAENASATEASNNQATEADLNSGTSTVDVNAATAQSTGLSATVAVIVLNVREQPDLESVVLGTLFQDDEVEVLGRNGTWWLICCAFGSDQPAWVNPDFLEPDFDTSDIDELLPVIGPASEESTPAAGSSVQAANASPELELEMSLNPRYVWQGLDFELNFVVRNVGESAVTNVVLRDELIQDLTFITANASNGGGVVKETLENGNVLVVVSWDELASGQSQTVSIQLRLDVDLEDGSVIDNLAVVGAAETSSSTTAGISIGLTPAELPIFK